MEGYVLYEVEIILNSCSRTLQAYGLPMPPPDLLKDLSNRLLMEERNYNRESLSFDKDFLISRLNSKPKHVFDLIIKAFTNYQQELVFGCSYGKLSLPFYELKVR